VAAHPDVGLRALVAAAARMRQPALSPVEVLGQLRRRYRMDEVPRRRLATAAPPLRRASPNVRLSDRTFGRSTERSGSARGPTPRTARVKTFGGWTYTQPTRGTYHWTSPQGRRYHRNPHRTTDLGAGSGSDPSP